MASKNQDLATNIQEAAVPEDRTDTLPILTTKFYRPPVTPDLEQRARLIEHLERNRQRPLTLISAPAGYGKTVLASQWLESCNCQSAWLSVDESDNNLGVFVSYLLAAISGTFPDLGSRTLNLLTAPNLPPVPVLAQTLTNDLDQINKPFILVMDDIHRIYRREICDLFDFLLQHPPHNLHLVMIGRHDPPLQISSMRARGQVTEVRALDLCFTSDETSRLMRKMLDREVDPAVAADWTNATEGWVTALRLAVLSLRHRGRDDDLGLRIRGDSRYLREYLLSEVLAHLPINYRDYLIKIAILDRFCGSLCEAVCQIDPTPELNGPAGETFIDWLVCENLFLIPLDDQHKWFRFHHLFQEMLLDMLHSYSSSSEIAELNMRACHWLEENDWVDEAIRHALAAGDTAHAKGLVTKYRQQLINQDRWNQLARWLELFPDEVVANDAILAITKSQLYNGFSQDAELRSQARRLLASLPADSPMAKEVRGELATGDALEGVLIGQAAKIIAESSEALEVLPSHALYHRSIAIGTQAMGYQMSGDFDRGIRIINRALSEPGLPVKTQARLLLYRAWLTFMESDLTAALRSSGESLRLAVKNDLWNTIGEARYISGIAYHLRNELALSEPQLRALVDEPSLYNPVYIAMAACALARIYQAQHHPEKATELLQRIIAYLEKIDNTFSLEILHAFQVELPLDQGDPALARRLSLNANFDGFHPFWFHYMVQLTPIKLMLTEGKTPGLTRSLNSLVQISEELRCMNRKVLHIEVLALLALVHHALGDISAAFDNLTEALRLGEPGGFIRSFVDLGTPMANLLQRSQEQQAGGQHADYIAQILAAFPKTLSLQVRTPQSQLDEALTNREFEVLTLLAKRLSNKEIAEQLSISLDTVKSHTSNIYSKLGVNNRKQAVKKAIELDLLPKD